MNKWAVFLLFFDNLSNRNSFGKHFDTNMFRKKVKKKMEENLNEEVFSTEENNIDTQTDHAAEIKEDSSEIEVANNKIAELNDKYLRLNAEFDNFRKRNAKERLELIQTAGVDIIRDLLDVLDDCDRSEKLFHAEDTDANSLKEGVLLIYGKLRKIMEQKGLSSFDSIEKEFDVEQHEAITEIPAPIEDMKGKVLDEVQKGYKLNGKLIRYAKVVVGK